MRPVFGNSLSICRCGPLTLAENGAELFIAILRLQTRLRSRSNSARQRDVEPPAKDPKCRSAHAVHQPSVAIRRTSQMRPIVARPDRAAARGLVRIVSRTDATQECDGKEPLKRTAVIRRAALDTLTDTLTVGRGRILLDESDAKPTSSRTRSTMWTRADRHQSFS
jgi:hypothetical protein